MDMYGSQSRDLPSATPLTTPTLSQIEEALGFLANEVLSLEDAVYRLTGESREEAIGPVALERDSDRFGQVLSTVSSLTRRVRAEAATLAARA